jgi:putative restriction endonuclease
MNWITENRLLLEKTNYVLKADESSKYWFGLSKVKIDEYIETFNTDFNIILIGSDSNPSDYYSIPYAYIQDLLIEANISRSENRVRWVGDIRTHSLHIRNARVERNISDFYGLPVSLRTGKLSLTPVEVNDYAVENAKREVQVRLKQSVFRKRVLENFNYRCCLTGTAEEDLLVASHIIPWADKIEHRLNPGNGLCLSFIYDKLFDKGYFTVGIDGRVSLSQRIDKKLSSSIRVLLTDIDQRQIIPPVNYKLLHEALDYHATHIFDKFK